jgi:sugar phosphate isomerase/epimerase
MRLSCLPVSFFADIVGGRMTVPDWARMALEIGLDGFDISILFVADRSAAPVGALRSEIDQVGLPLVMVTSYPDFTHPDAAQRERELELEREVVRVSADLGARYVRVTAGQAHPETGRDEGIAWAVEGLSRLVDATRSSGITLAYENHAKPGAWRYTGFSQRPDIFLEIVERTAGVGLGVNFDTGNAASFAEDPVALLEAVRGRVVSVHAADTAANGVQEAVLLGTGVAPFPALFASLKRADWDGWICMEEYAVMGREGVEKAASFVRSTWREA